jgi:hypothetical protein
MIMLLTAMLCIPRVSAQAQELVVLGQDTDIHENYYNGHLVCNGFGAVIAMALPTGRFQITATKGLFAASLGGGWSEGSGCSEAFYTPFVGSMWFEVAGDSPYFPSPNVIVDNTGSGGNCSESFIILIKVLATALPLLYELLKETPPLTEWQRPSAHSLMAISRDLAGGSLTLVHGLRTAAADFYSRFDVEGVQTLTVTAWAEIWLQKYMPYYRDGVVSKWKVGEYSVGFSVDVVADLPPNDPPHPEGPTTGYKGVSYTYDAGTTDPEDDDIMYEFDWGDGTTTLTGWVDSGTMVSRSHSRSSTGTYYVKVRAQDSYGLWSGWSVKLQVSIYSGGGGSVPCPTLLVWNGSAYVDYGVIDIHNPSGEDVIREVPIQTEDVCLNNYKAKFRLREGWEGLNFSESVIDQVKLYAIGNDGNRYQCPLIKATHSREGNVLPQLLRSDDYRAQMLLLETVDLTFAVPWQNIQGYTFTIEGCNMLKM